MPDGLSFLKSWLASDRSHCCQIMESGSPEIFDRWFPYWAGLVSNKVGEKPVM
ncbi:DUF3303 family protein [Rhodobacteraceae bacterium NNCM2]|nr:DUF3303 family protein [Coraliihabitans acroporae]